MSVFDDRTFGLFIAKAMETKARMLQAPGETGSFDCPKCGAKVEVRLIGPRHHSRAACPTKDCWNLIE